MGVESDRLVFDYLSRVGDLAQTALPAADRMRLVARLRSDIERARGEGDSAAAVQRILGGFGSPDEVVEAAAGTSGPGAGGGAAGSGAGGAPPAGEPAPGSYGPYAKPRREVPRSRAEGARSDGSRLDGSRSGTSPSRGEVPRSRGEREPEWWGGGLGEARLRAGDEVAGLPGMTGGIFIPFDDEELGGKSAGEELRPLPGALARGGGDGEEPGEDAEDGEPYEEGPRRRRRLRGLLRRGGGAVEGGGVRVRRWGSPLLLLAAALLVAGTVIGSWIPLGLGWLAGYLSRTLTRTQAKIAVFGVAGATVLGYGVWFWGRDAGRWGTPVPQGHLGDAIQDALPTAVRIAAVGSAVYFLWRARRSA